MVRLKLKRKYYGENQTLGTMDVYRNDTFICSFATLEKRWNNNITSDSCILPGIYPVEKWNSNSHPETFILCRTEPRTGILIHSGNYYTDTEGCILIGYCHADINLDVFLDVIQSKEAMKRLNNICKYENTISIQIE